MAIRKTVSHEPSGSDYVPRGCRKILRGGLGIVPAKPSNYRQPILYHHSSNELKSLQEENRKLREENQALACKMVPSRHQTPSKPLNAAIAPSAPSLESLQSYINVKDYFEESPK